MAGYPIVEGETRVEYGRLLADVTAIFSHCGMNGEDARLLAESLAMADLRGVHSHGVLRVPEYVKKLMGGGVDPAGRPRVVKDSGAACVVDGGNSMGVIGCAFAMREAIRRAEAMGVGAAAVGGSNHCGALFYPAMMALEHGMIGIVTSNALPTMAPWGGVEKILGINPLAIAAPAGVEPPLVLDAAFSASSHGKIRVFHQKGLPIPTGWAFDAEGAPTTDAEKAIHGLLQPIGEFKGVGMAVMMGVLASLLSGAAFGTELGNMVDGPQAGRDGQFVMALRVDAFEDHGKFCSRADGVVRQIRESRPAHGFERCYAPGELEFATEQAYRQDGIPLNAETLAGLNALLR
jgi:LDH2 family malate/lactate/ureidoglycolate dehydrogenase